MKLLAYKGKSWLSWVIKKQTRSEYSHVAILLDDGVTVIEAWAGSGVVVRESIDEGHTSGTEVDVFSLPKSLNSMRAEQFLRDQEGMPYDYRSVIRFISHKPASENGAWFCSELVVTALAYGFVSLLRGNSSEMSPRDVVLSPLLTYERTEFTK